MSEGGEKMQQANELRERMIQEFAENYMEKLFYFCLKKTGNQVEAEDLTQEIALQIIGSLNKGTIPTSFSAWVWQIARNCYAGWANEKHRRQEAVSGSDIGDYEIEDESENILDEMIHREEMSLLRRELAFIKSDYRNIVVAYYIENKSIRQIALALTLPENTVKSRLFRAREILKEGMDMAREFGKRSYKPEEITYSNICTCPGEHGQPWVLMDPKMNQNIFLACYDNPMTAEELAIEVGVALPYMEDTVKHLTWQTLLVKKGDKYETNFPIVSREMQEKIHFYYEGIMPQLVACMTEATDCLMAQYEEAGLCYYGAYQSYDDAKWTLLPNFYKAWYALCKSSPKTEFGQTKRPSGGIWDVLAYEKCDLTPEGVGYHCQHDGFKHYRFGYAGIHNRTPSFLSKEECYELYSMVMGKKPTNLAIAEKLVGYGYAYQKDGQFIPNVVVISEGTAKAFIKFAKKKNQSAEFISNSNRRTELHIKIMELIDNINQTLREILNEDLPENIRNNKTMVDALLNTMCTAGYNLGSVIKYAVASGWLKYDENTSPAIGAFFNVK